MDYSSRKIRISDAQRQLLIFMENKPPLNLGMHIWHSPLSLSQEHQNIQTRLSAEDYLCSPTVCIYGIRSTLQIASPRSQEFYKAPLQVRP